jgi:hypothetical protein
MILTRGYTLTELMVASTLTLFVCMGGVTAAKVHRDAERRAQALRVALDVSRRLDTRTQSSAEERCCLERALDASAPPRTCQQLQTALRTGSVTLTGQLSTGGVSYAMAYAVLPAEPSIVKVTTVFRTAQGELFKHGSIVVTP